MWKNTITRSITAVVGIMLLFAVLCLDYFLPYQDNIVFEISIGVITLLMLFELFHAFNYGWRFTLLSLTGSLFMVSVLSFWSIDFFLGAVVIYVIFLILLAVFSHKQTNFSDIAIMLFATIYITSFTNCLVRAMTLDTNGLFYVLLIFICAWMNDTGAYFAGKLWGKRKLAPLISPKKTVEGSIGGIICAVVFATVLSIIAQFVFYKTINYSAVVIIALIGACLGQLGDLVASLMKRQSGVKDFGSIMPGHGGVLDRFDSVILIAPFVYYAAKLLINLDIPLIS